MLRHAVEIGVTFADTAELYGQFENEKSIGRTLGACRDEVIPSKKASIESDDGTVHGRNDPPEYTSARRRTAR